MYRSRSARSPDLREPDSRLAESDKIEGAGGWDALEWTKIDPVSRSVPIGVKQFLLEDEHVVVEGYGVVLVNTDDAGTLFVTNFRLLFLSEGSRDIIALGTVPLATIEKFQKIVMKLPSGQRHPEKTGSQRLLQIIGKDMRIIVFGFRPRTKQNEETFSEILCLCALKSLLFSSSGIYVYATKLVLSELRSPCKLTNQVRNTSCTVH